MKLRQRFAQTVLIVGGGVVLFVGVLFLFSPEAALAPVGIRLNGPSAFNEVRGSFGGMHVGVGALILAGAFVPSARRWALWLLVAFMAGLAAGRVVSIRLDGVPGARVQIYLLVEVVLSGLGMGALRLTRAP